MRLYGRGIRRRLAPMLDGDRRRIELAYSLMFTLPGAPLIRYGEEIGMGDDLRLHERQSSRTPMQWSSDEQGGFTTAKKSVLPVIDDPIFGYRKVNVAGQRVDAHSLLNWMERIIRTRKEHPEIGWGEWKIIGTGSRNVVAIRYDWRGDTFIAVHNLDAKPHRIKLRAEAKALTNLLSDDHSDDSGDGAHKMAIEGYGYRWYHIA